MPDTCPEGRCSCQQWHPAVSILRLEHPVFSVSNIRVCRAILITRTEIKLELVISKLINNSENGCAEVLVAN